MLAPNTLLQNRYLIVRLIGQGGMGAVYQAVDQRLGNTVALKQTLTSDPQFSRAFGREARMLAVLRHPALPKVIDHFTDDGGQFLVMEFIAGNDLTAMLIARGGPFALEEVLHWGDQILDVLDYLHSQQPPIIHRDIKPQNMKLTPRGEIILLDFGLAKGSALQSTTTATGSLFGYTPQYAPLEQIQGTGTDPRSDLYALAATIYYLLTYAPPINALTRAASVLSRQPDPLRPARELRPNIPAAVDAVLNQALALDIGERPSSAAAMRAALAAALESARQATVPQTRGEKRIVTLGQPPRSVTPAQAARDDTIAGAGAVPRRSADASRRSAFWLLPAVGSVALLAIIAALLLVNRGDGRGAATAIGSSPSTVAAAVMTQHPPATALPISAVPAASPPLDPPRAAATPTPAPPGAGLQAGQMALTRMPAIRALWTDAAGGQHVSERPRLFGGAQVTILAIAPDAVQVRTEEGIEGWIHEPANQALTADLTQISLQRRFTAGVQVHVVWPRGIPVRDAPRSSASKVVEQLKAGEGGVVLAVLGDWLKIELEDGRSAWARWYYDGTFYIDIASALQPPPFTRRLLVQSPRLTGADVHAVQQRLNDLTYWSGDADGIYGPETEAAIKSFQANNGLEADGIVGSQTWAYLFSSAALPYEHE